MIYIVYEKPLSYYDGDGDTVNAVFSSMEKAVSYKNNKKYPKHFFIEVWSVDE